MTAGSEVDTLLESGNTVGRQAQLDKPNRNISKTSVRIFAPSS
jgi:hypothetical protein